MWNIIYLITGAIFIVLLIAIFFSKEVIDSKENTLFKYILVISLIGYLIEIPLQIIVRTIDINHILVDILCKFYLVSIASWYSLFTMYVFVIGFNKESKNYEKVIRVSKLFIIVMHVVITFLLLLLPFSKYYDMSKMYIEGLAIDMLKLYIVIQMIIYIVLLIINHKNLRNKKYLPIYFVLICLVFVTILNSIDPSILISTMVGTFICYTMFFTIENPDLKMIRELEVAREQADKANSAKTDFLSSMSHEIRTPLNAIVGFSDCIMDAESLGEAKENAKDIVNASQTLLEIVNGILDISKIEAGKIEIVNSKYNAPETFEELAKLITPRMNEKGLDFTYTIAPDLPDTLFGDHANLKKIVTNLLSNACKYTDKGFVHYEVNCINTHNVSKLIISVEDSGRGIKKDSVDKMFTRFQRLEEDRNTTIEGTGLGLAITKQLIELMGGRIILHTIYGQGSKFTVVLNQKITQPDIESVKKVKTTLDLTDVKIMLVDDTPLNLKVASKLLEKYNANHIITCSSGFECLDRIKRGEVYDLILLDDMMPKMSGVETLKQLKQIPGFKVPTVALTANAISGMREKYLADGFDDFLAKPIEKDQMIQVINQLLGRSVTEDIQISQKDITNVSVETPNIRADVVPNVAELTKNIEDRKNQAAEDEANKNNPDIIPVEENIEEILGDQLDMNYREKTMKMKPMEVENVENVEVLDEPVLIDNSQVQPVAPVTPVVPVQAVQTAPVQPVQTVPVQPVSTVPVQPVEQIPTVPVVPVSTPSAVSYDRSYLESNGVDVNHGLELLGDMEMYNMTINDFMKEVEAKWSRIVDYKNQNNMPDYAIEVHSLKSDCKYL